MNFPFWDTGIGYGLLMALIAVIHVFVSHFAIGGGLFLIVTERLARKNDDQPTLDYLQKLSKFFVLATVVFGALSGVGIWFVIGLLNPVATQMLIRTFVWAWAIEWTFFVIEIAAALFYYYGWKRMTPSAHMTLGWIYFVASWLSLFAINGIITFMLTPGEWPADGNFWSGFFNPTFWPSLVIRTGICIMLAGLYATLVASRYEASAFKARIVRYSSWYGLVGTAIILPSFLWYLGAIPENVMDTAREIMATPMAAIEQSYLYLAVIAGLMVLGLLLPRRISFPVAVVTMVFGLAWFGAFEWFRESIRKPYVITEFMYGNGLELSRVAEYRETGLLPHIKYPGASDGRDLFNHACRRCHTIDGYKPLKPAFDGTDRDFITGIIGGLDVMKGNMPPFVGTAEEAATLAAYLEAATDRRSFDAVYNLEGVALGQKAYEVRCGKCHVVGGFNDKSESLAGLDDEEYNDILDDAEYYADEMPPYTGDETERLALIEFLKTLKEGSN